jgi:hypothetical protein
MHSLANWDVAYGTYEMLQEALPILVDRIKTSYDTDVPIIWRPGQYYCCRKLCLFNCYSNKTSLEASLKRKNTGADLKSDGKSRRRLSRLRVESFNHLIQATLKAAFPYRFQVWDIYQMGERQPPEIKQEVSNCASNHMNRVGVDLENQILMNLLCPVS